MSVNTAVMSETILEGLNEVFYDSYNPQVTPDYALLDSVFKMNTSKKHDEFDLEMKGTGPWKIKGEEQDINEDTIKEKFKTQYTHVAYANSVPVSFEYMEDELYNIVKDDIGNMGLAARDTDYRVAFGIFNNAFNSAFPGADGKSLIATDHPRDSAGVLNNMFTDKLSESVLNAMIAALAQQKSMSGSIIPNVPDTLLVSPFLYPLAVKLLEAKLVPGSNNNDPNVFSVKYGIKLKQSPYLGAAAGGNDHAFFLLGTRHKIKRFERSPIRTWITPWQQSRKMTTYYNGYYRNSYGWSSPIGIVGSDGSTGSYPS